MPNWRLMIEIIWHSNANKKTYNINNRAFTCPFLAIANIRLRQITGYNIDNARYWQIYNKGQFETIVKTNNPQQRPIQMYKEHTGTHRNAQERIGAHRKDV